MGCLLGIGSYCGTAWHHGMGWDVTDGKREDGDVNVAFDVVESWDFLIEIWKRWRLPLRSEICAT